jgi:WD40 repeat protein
VDGQEEDEEGEDEGEGEGEAPVAEAAPCDARRRSLRLRLRLRLRERPEPALSESARRLQEQQQLQEQRERSAELFAPTASQLSRMLDARCLLGLKNAETFDVARLLTERSKGAAAGGFSIAWRWAASSSRWSAYNMDVSADGALVCAGGSEGEIRLFAVPDDALLGSWQQAREDVPSDEEETQWATETLTLVAHERWVSEVNLTALRDDEGVPFMLSSSDDGLVRLWSVRTLLASHGADATPLATAAGLHRGFGVYSLHCNGDSVATAGKDGRVVLSALLPSSLVGGVGQMEGFHDGVVKCVRWRDRDTLASCGNDRRVSVFDVRVRSHGSCVMQFEPDALHRLAVNTVRWRPGHPFQLLSSSFDKTIAISDIRRPDGPLITMGAYWPGNESRAGAIHHPCFFEDGLFVLATAARSTSLSVFSATSGERLRTVQTSEALSGVVQAPRRRLLLAAGGRLLLGGAGLV